MAMPQVHIVAYCGDLGYGPARGAEMRSAMLWFGILSRIGSGLIADREGADVADRFAAAGDRAVPLSPVRRSYVAVHRFRAVSDCSKAASCRCMRSSCGGIFSPKEVGICVGIVLMATLFGMALGDWMSGIIFDHTGSYRAAFLNGLIWNVVNAVIVLWLLLQPIPQIGRRVATVVVR
jgi:MFS family permease